MDSLIKSALTFVGVRDEGHTRNFNISHGTYNQPRRVGFTGIQDILGIPSEQVLK